MNDQTVGMENLPNVYIEKIGISKNTRTNVVLYNIRVTLIMCDSEDKPTWRGRIDGLNVKCSLISDERIENLNSGLSSLYNVSADEAGTQVDNAGQFQYYRRENGYVYFKRTFEFSSRVSSNLNVYAACFIDDLSFGIDQFDKFYGPMAGEVIFSGGELNTDSGYFYYPITNEEYGGPVHTTEDGGYMEGSEHSDRDHANLVYVAEENFKITVAPETSTPLESDVAVGDTQVQ